jgi:hypothetical protein
MIEKHRYWHLIPKKEHGPYTTEIDVGRSLSESEVLPILKKKCRMSRVSEIIGYDIPIKEMPKKEAILTVTFQVKVKYRDPRGLEIVKESLKEDPGFGTDWDYMVTAHPIKNSIVVE